MVFKLIFSQGILTLTEYLQKNQQAAFQEELSLFYPSVVPTAAIFIVMPYDLVGHIFKIQQLHIGFSAKG